METERLLIRHPQLGDEVDLLELRNSEYVLKYNCMKKITIEQLQEELRQEMASEDDSFCIVLKESNKIIGKVDVSPDSLRYRINSLGISYYLGEQYASKGYMTEALREVLRYVFEERSAEVLSVRAFRSNAASIRLIEKLGFTHEGCIRRGVMGYQDVVYDDMIYSILREEYKTRQHFIQS